MRRGEEKKKFLFPSPRLALRVKYHVRPAWLIKRLSCRLAYVCLGATSLLAPYVDVFKAPAFPLLPMNECPAFPLKTTPWEAASL